MTTYTPRKADASQKWHLIDASGQTLGRLASQVAQLLRGKLNPRYATHLDMGDHVVVVNADQIVVTGRKADQKVYYRHSNYPGGLKVMSYDQMMRRYPERIIEHAVKGMLPKTALGRAMYGKLRVYKGMRHPHAGQLGSGSAPSVATPRVEAAATTPSPAPLAETPPTEETIRIVAITPTAEAGPRTEESI